MARELKVTRMEGFKSGVGISSRINYKWAVNLKKKNENFIWFFNGVLWQIYSINQFRTFRINQGRCTVTNSTQETKISALIIFFFVRTLWNFQEKGSTFSKRNVFPHIHWSHTSPMCIQIAWKWHHLVENLVSFPLLYNMVLFLVKAQFRSIFHNDVISVMTSL